MKDIYSALGVKPKASDEEIAAIVKLKPENSDLAAILLDQRKRALYDSTYTTLKTIGELRRRLGLDDSKSWFEKNCPDFVPKPSTAAHPLQTEESTSTTNPPEQEFLAERVVAQKSQPVARSKLQTALILASIVTILIFLFAWIF